MIGVLLCIVSLLALHLGTIMIPIGGGIQSILNGMGIPVHFTEPITAEQEAVLWFIRMPTPHHRFTRRWCLGTRWCRYARRFLKPTSGSRYYGRICRGIPRRSYRHCPWCNISRHVLHACLCLRRGLCISWDYYSFNFA